MPEGAEVKLSADTIRPLIVGKRVIGTSLGPHSRYHNDCPLGLILFASELSQLDVRVMSVKTKGKFMWWEFSNGYYLLCTFGMSGRWHDGNELTKHLCLVFAFGENPEIFPDSTLAFSDPRHFGTINFIKNEHMLLNKLNSLGWDPLQTNLEDYQGRINSAIQKSNKPIAQLLMDQSIFAGVGNYVKCEALYRSNISPWRPGKSFSSSDIDILCQAIDNVMHESYNRQGATISTYKTVSGKSGNFSNFFKVYGRKLDPHNNKIIKETTPDKRSTYWCPSIQK